MCGWSGGYRWTIEDRVGVALIVPANAQDSFITPLAGLRPVLIGKFEQRRGNIARRQLHTDIKRAGLGIGTES